MLNFNKTLFYKLSRSFLFFCFSLFVLFSFTNSFYGDLTGIKFDTGISFHLADDPMITFRVAYNFWLTGKPYYNINEAVSATTSLFWPIIISPVYFFVKHNHAILIFYLLSIFLYSLIVFLITYYEDDDLKAISKSLLFLFTPATLVYATSGFEHIPQALFVSLSFLIIQNDYKKNKFLKISNTSFFLLCVSFMLRPDSAPLILVTGIYWIITNFFQKNKKIDKYFSFITGLLCLGILVAYIYAMMFYFSEIKPNTAYLKMLSIKDSLFLGIKYILSPGLSNLWPYAFLFILISYSKLNSVQKFFVKCILAQLAYIIYVGGDFFYNARFFILIIPVLIILLVDVLDVFLEKNVKKDFFVKIRSGLLIFFLIGQFINYHNIRESLLLQSTKHSLASKKQQFLFQKDTRYIESLMILANSINKNLKATDGSIGIHRLGIGYHLPKFHIVDFFGKSEKHIARTPYKTLDTGHNKWDYIYAFKTYDIAVVPVWIWVLEEVNKSNYKYKGDSGGFRSAFVEHIIKTNKYEFLYAKQIGIKEELSYGIFVRKDLVNNFTNSGG